MKRAPDDFVFVFACALAGSLALGACNPRASNDVERTTPHGETSGSTPGTGSAGSNTGANGSASGAGTNAQDGGAQPLGSAALPPEPVPATCAPAEGVTLFAAPRAPKPGDALRVVAVSEKAIEGTFEAIAPGGAGPAAATGERHGGPPYAWHLDVPNAVEGSYALHFRAPGVHACLDVAVARADPPAPKVIAWGVWPIVAEWSPATENLFSAWIERLFDDPLDRQPAWPALQQVLRDAKRNFLHDYLGGREDDPPEGGGHAPLLRPDCADLPYALRAYFAFKLGLPFGFSSCTRGGPAGPPRCDRWHSLLAEARGDGGARGFGNFVRVQMADRVHSGSARAVPDGDGGDYYPIPLRADSLRPGRIFADPYGHVLMVVRRIAQAKDAGGVLLAVDGQPDGTVSRRRFWRGNFLFDDNPLLGFPGFKRFRPIVIAPSGAARPLTNDEIATQPGYGDFSLQQRQIGVAGFYDAMDDVLSPEPLDPELAFKETLQALEEQVKGRVLSVKNGDEHFQKRAGRIDMPEGPRIFETEGPWEDFSTPSRDLRLLIAIDVVKGFPARFARRPERFAVPAGKSNDAVRAALDALLTSETAARRFSYPRSDGSPFELSLADVIARAKDLEMAYNPNDCPEVRWGAPAASPEIATCRRRAPRDQQTRMAQYRAWFADRKRPARK